MFNTTKFKKGDYVVALDNLSKKLLVENVYLQEERLGYEEYVVCDDGKKYHKLKLTFYSAPIDRLNYELSTTKEQLFNLTKEFNEFKDNYQKEFNEFRDKVLKKNKSIFSGFTLYVTPFWGNSTEKKEEVKTLEERIEELEQKQPIKKLVKKNKKIIKNKKVK